MTTSGSRSTAAKFMPFVKRPGGGASVADARRADHAVELAAQPPGHQRAGHYGNHRAEVADHGKQPLARTAAVDVAVPGAHGAER